MGVGVLWYLGFGIWGVTKFGIWDLRGKIIWDLGFGENIWDLGFEVDKVPKTTSQSMTTNVLVVCYFGVLVLLCGAAWLVFKEGGGGNLFLWIINGTFFKEKLIGGSHEQIIRFYFI